MKKSAPKEMQAKKKGSYIDADVSMKKLTYIKFFIQLAYSINHSFDLL